MSNAPHIYEAGLLGLCRVCRKAKVTGNHVSQDNMTDEGCPNLHTCIVCKANTSDECATCHEYVCKSCSSKHLNGHEPVKPKQIKEEKPEEVKKPCPGHPCPECGNDWKHPYDCNKERTQTKGLCRNCSQQAASEINRPKSIEVIKKESESPLTGREEAELFNRTYDFAVKNLIYDPDGKERADWNDRVQKFIDAKLRIQHELRIELSAARKAQVKKQTDDLSKLSPEEIAQYKRDAAKLKKPKEKKNGEAAPAKTSDERQKAHKKVLKGLCDMLLMMNPQLTVAQAEDLAQKKLAQQQEVK